MTHVRARACAGTHGRKHFQRLRLETTGTESKCVGQRVRVSVCVLSPCASVCVLSTCSSVCLSTCACICVRVQTYNFDARSHRVFPDVRVCVCVCVCVCVRVCVQAVVIDGNWDTQGIMAVLQGDRRNRTRAYATHCHWCCIHM